MRRGRAETQKRSLSFSQQTATGVAGRKKPKTGCPLATTSCFSRASPESHTAEVSRVPRSRAQQGVPQTEVPLPQASSRCLCLRTFHWVPGWGCFLSTPTSGHPPHLIVCVSGRMNAGLSFPGVRHTFLGVRLDFGPAHCTLGFPAAAQHRLLLQESEEFSLSKWLGGGAPLLTS